MEVGEDNNRDKKLESQQRRERYQLLLNRITDLQENGDVGINSVNELNNIFKEAKAIDIQCAIEDRVEYASETLLESLVISSASGVLVKQLENFDLLEKTYEPLEFSEKLINFINDEPDENTANNEWLNLLQDAREIVPKLPSYTFLYGTFDPTKLNVPKSKNQHKREAQEQVQKKKLQKVHTLEKEEEGIEETVNFLMNVLTEEYEKCNSVPLNYFDFVVDSKSFSVTVENMFYTSFLIRDGKAELNIGIVNNPTIKPMRKRHLKTFRNEGGINTQTIMSFTMDNWEKIKRKGHIETHRNLIKANN